MTTEQKTVFDADLLRYKKAKYEACKKDLKAIDCTGADKIRAAEEKKRNTDKYYAKKTVDREAYDKTQAEETKKLKASLTAAALEAAKPKAGEVGFSCLADRTTGKRPACGATQCCGHAKFSGKTTGFEICNEKTATTWVTKISGKDMTYAFVCGAKHLIASATAALAAAYLM